jgi:hypothetical protein
MMFVKFHAEVGAPFRKRFTEAMDSYFLRVPD